MGKTYESLSDDHRAWIEEQHMFFVSTAPLNAAGHVNLSPKGYDTFRIVDAKRVAYLDLTGSGIETLSHLAENGRITVMFCAFEGRPRVLRIYGRGVAVRPGDDRFEALVAQFGEPAGLRSIVEIDIEFVRSSCGYSIPIMGFESDRQILADWAEAKGSDGLSTYWQDRNAESIDGLAGIA